VAALRDRRAPRPGPTWLAVHLDTVRILGVVSAVVAATLLSSWTALAVIALALAAFEVAVTLVARAGHSTPDRSQVAGGAAEAGSEPLVRVRGSDSDFSPAADDD